MSLRDELQSITPEEARWALMSLFEQGRTSVQVGQAEQSLEARSQMVDREYPGIVALSNLALQSISKAESFGTYSNQAVVELCAQFMVFSLAHIADIRAASPGTQ